MNIVKYTKIRTFKFFNKWNWLTITESYSEHSDDEVDELEPIIVQISDEYYKDEFEVDEDGDTE